MIAPAVHRRGARVRQPRGLAAFRRRRPRDRGRARAPRRARDRERADRRRAGPGRRRAPARAAAAEPAADAGLGGGDDVRAGGRDQRGRRRLLRGLPGRAAAGRWCSATSPARAPRPRAHRRGPAHDPHRRARSRPIPCRGLYVLDREPARPRRRRALLGRAAGPPRRRVAERRRCASTSPGTRTRSCSARARAEPVGDPGPLLGVVDEPIWAPVAVDGRAGRPAGRSTPTG